MRSRAPKGTVSFHGRWTVIVAPARTVVRRTSVVGSGRAAGSFFPSALASPTSSFEPSRRCSGPFGHSRKTSRVVGRFGVKRTVTLPSTVFRSFAILTSSAYRGRSARGGGAGGTGRHANTNRIVPERPQNRAVEERELGATGIRLKRVVLGCGNFGGIGSAPELFGTGESDDEAFAIMDTAWSLGMTSFDTADAYGGGRSESAIGKWIAATGNRPTLTTKTFAPMDAGHDHGLGRDRILRQIDSSLERLGVDHVDLYLAHAPDHEPPVEETVGAFEELVDRGLIRAYGVSNVTADDLRAALAVG